MTQTFSEKGFLGSGPVSDKRVYQELARRGTVKRNMLKRIYRIIEVLL
jgi:hypothetical protein